ncbi:prolipoprotein diacylglyceryl transferase [Vallitalea sp.]|jgi:phosphatidylglycerol:prolipoprotein diacylglycerol transferase|uniref:prolipoprotein diacylglyceryl transferase n=1 Tax=Vallitalea sp. TaxID=1882829 RepID=UPI0025F76BED|nr:prolipoprotein diacylglyceryl transferase [Vallitalea sp.]MCT4688191.1 prolipoprotein diacylglyceryl transferase [Vallitalea sp.]
MNLTPDIIFPNLGIEIKNIDPVAFRIFGLDVYWYGLIIGFGILAGLFVAIQLAKRNGIDEALYPDFLIYALIVSIVSARLFYVIFSWDEYKDNLVKIFAFREGGLAIYGGIIGAVITLIIFSKRKKVDFWNFADTAAPGLILGQIIGRWGNFVNMEAFGGYTENHLAMMLKTTKAKYIPVQLLDKIKTVNGVDYIQVQPTFLYESLWNLGVLVLLLIYFKRRKFNGEIFALYLLGYGLGRVWIEGLRTDQLIIGSSGIPVSQLLAGVLIVVSLVFIIIMRRKRIR